MVPVWSGLGLNVGKNGILVYYWYIGVWVCGSGV